MASRTTHNVTKPGFLVEQSNAAREPGRQINWSAFDASYENSFGNKELKGGTVVALDGSGKIIPWDPGVDTAAGILATSANEDSNAESLSGYGFIVGGNVYENMLELDGGTLANAKSELKSASDYGFHFVTYADDR